MGVADNRTTARRIVEEVVNQGNLALVDQLFAKNYTDHATPPGVPAGPDGFKLFFGALRSAFPDLNYTIDQEITEGDKVVQHVTGHGTMQGEFQGMQPSGKTATWTEIHIARFSDGKIVEHWANVDQVGMLQQLGFGPTTSH